MTERNLIDLKINQIVRMKSKLAIEGFYLGTVKCINDHRKRIGVESETGKYKEYSYKDFLRNHF